MAAVQGDPSVAVGRARRPLDDVEGLFWKRRKTRLVNLEEGGPAESLLVAEPLFGMGVERLGKPSVVALEVVHLGHGHEEQGATEAKLGKVEDQLADAYHSLLEYLDRWVLPEGEECGDLYLKLVILISSFIVRNPKWLDDVRANADVHAADLERNRFLSDDDVVAMDLNGCSGELGALVELAYLNTALFQYYEGTPLYSLIEMLLGMDCCFYKAIVGANFITASFPVYAAWEDESDTNPSAAYFPLSPNYAVVFRRKSRDDSFMSVGRLDDAQVKKLNRMLMNGNCVWDSLIARDRTCLESLAKEYLPGGR